MKTVPDWVHHLIKEYSTDRFHADYNGFLYNHTYHGIISVWRLGADEARTRRFAEDYVKQLEPARDEPCKGLSNIGTLTHSELQGLQGQRKSYLKLVAHFRQLLQDLDGNYEQLLNQEFPTLVAGLGSAAFHGLIQLGYGHLVHNERVFCEGLAYLHYSYVPQKVTSCDSMCQAMGSGTIDVMDVLRKVKQDTTLLDFVDKNHMIFNDDRDERGDFLGRIHSALGKKGDVIVEYVRQMKLPDWFNQGAMDDNQLTRLAKWIVDSTILVYLMSEAKNDFFLVHAVTGAAGLSQILPVLESTDVALTTIGYFLSAFVGVYIARRCPALLEDNIKTKVCPDWEGLLKKALVDDLDEHVYKLVDVCHTRGQENDGFLHPSIYYQAAQLAVNYPLLKD